MPVSPGSVFILNATRLTATVIDVHLPSPRRHRAAVAGNAGRSLLAASSCSVQYTAQIIDQSNDAIKPRLPRRTSFARASTGFLQRAPTDAVADDFTGSPVEYWRRSAQRRGGRRRRQIKTRGTRSSAQTNEESARLRQKWWRRWSLKQTCYASRRHRCQTSVSAPPARRCQTKPPARTPSFVVPYTTQPQQPLKHQLHSGLNAMYQVKGLQPERVIRLYEWCIRLINDVAYEVLLRGWRNVARRTKLCARLPPTQRAMNTLQYSLSW